MFGIAGTAELSTFCPGTGTWNRLQDGIRLRAPEAYTEERRRSINCLEYSRFILRARL